MSAIQYYAEKNWFEATMGGKKNINMIELKQAEK
jgi:hypothetical protein